MSLRALAAALTVALALGCSFVEELDKSSAEMDKYSPGARALTEKRAKEAEEKKAKSGASKTASTAAQVKQAASEWWGNARSLAPDETDESVVRCILQGGEQFMGRQDCLMRGGSVAKR
jgi:hypothetical protein